MPYDGPAWRPEIQEIEGLLGIHLTHGVGGEEDSNPCEFVFHLRL